MQEFGKKSLTSSKYSKQGNDGFWIYLKNLCVKEIDQKEKFSHQLVNQILYSKRLLVDHVDSLELTLPNLAPAQPAEFITFRNTSIVLVGSMIQRFITPRHLKFAFLPVSLLSGVFCSLYIGKKICDIRLKYIEREMDKLIQALDAFGNCIKRNIMYFNEILVMKPQELIESRQIERAWDCITSVKEVIDILYDSTRKLEENYKLSPKFHEFYYPMEELRESDYFTKNVTDFTPKNIKDFYNIYSYVQSQFLLRLALTICQYNKIKFILDDVPEIQRLIQQHVNEEEEHFIDLALELRSKQQMEIANIHEQQPCITKSGPIAVLKESSMKLSSCIIAVAEECQKLDISLRKIDQIKFGDDSKTGEGSCLLDIANSMRVIENSLEMCYEDFQRLMIVYNKFLNTKLDLGVLDEANETNSSDELKQTETSTAKLTGAKNEEEIERKDDFFAYLKNEIEESSEKHDKTCEDYDFELINLEEKKTKGKFKPVLKQLKARINPIKKEMLEKERKVLESKGIDISKLIDCEISKDDNTNDEKELDHEMDESDSEGSADEIEKSLPKNKRDNYEDMRKFLAQKEAINILSKTSIPLEKHVEEDILE